MSQKLTISDCIYSLIAILYLNFNINHNQLPLPSIFQTFKLNDCRCRLKHSLYFSKLSILLSPCPNHSQNGSLLPLSSRINLPTVYGEVNS